MEELVIMKDKQAVTSSLRVAEVFGKSHKNVIQTIESKISSAENSAQYSHMFAKGSYKDKSGKSNKLYYMNRDGFSFIAFGFTGKKADSFKLEYINAFNYMEETLKQPTKLSATEQLRLIAESNVELDDRVSNLEGNMRVTGTQEFKLKNSASKRVLTILGGKESSAYEKMSSVVFRQIWHDFKKYFELPRYGELPQIKFNDGLQYIQAWLPDTETRIEIANCNAQTNIF